MLDRERWDFHPEWLEYIKRVWEGRGRVELKHDDSRERLAFMERSRTAFIARGIPARTVKTYVSVQCPEMGDGYAEQYPHTHHPAYATTLVHYLQPGDKPAPLDIFEGDQIIETIYPERGLTVFIPNNVLHGVRKNQGIERRIQFIATALK